MTTYGFTDMGKELGNCFSSPVLYTTFYSTICFNKSLNKKNTMG